MSSRSGTTMLVVDSKRCQAIINLLLRSDKLLIIAILYSLVVVVNYKSIVVYFILIIVDILGCNFFLLIIMLHICQLSSYLL